MNCLLSHIYKKNTLWGTKSLPLIWDRNSLIFQKLFPFFGAFTEFVKKQLLSLSCLSAWSNSVSSRWIFMKFYIWGFLKKSVMKIQVYKVIIISYHKHNCLLHVWDKLHSWQPCSLIMWKYMAEADRPQMTI